MQRELKVYISLQRALLLILCILLLSSCISPKVDMTMVKNSKGWIDENTYAIVALGRPIKSLDTELKQKKSAKRAALINARFKILKKFKSFAKISSSQSTTPDTGSKNTNLLKRIIKNGEIVYENFDQRNNCEIIYQVHYKNLKTLVKNADLSTIDVVY